MEKEPCSHYVFERQGDLLVLKANKDAHIPSYIDPVDGFMFLPLQVEGHRAEPRVELRFVTKQWAWSKDAKNTLAEWKMHSGWSDGFKERVTDAMRMELGEWLDTKLKTGGE